MNLDDLSGISNVINCVFVSKRNISMNEAAFAFLNTNTIQIFKLQPTLFTRMPCKFHFVYKFHTKHA